MGSDSTEFNLATMLGQQLLVRQWRCAVAESCTGGRLAAAITDVVGSSQWFDRGFVTYTNQAKIDMLGVTSVILDTHGAVSEATVCAMAEGALVGSLADITVAVSGVAGPGGGSIEKPVGLVWIAWSGRHFSTETQSHLFTGDRLSVRSQAVCVALEGLIRHCA